MMESVFNGKILKVSSYESKPMEIAFKFFYLFARFEFGLKALKFHNGDGEAKPNWDHFANELKDKFDFQNDKIRESVDYYFKSPPKKQMIKAGELYWMPEKCRKKDLKKLFVYLRRARNNLFHGGKFRGRYFEDPDRSQKLLKCGITILTYCAEIYPDIEEAINK